MKRHPFLFFVAVVLLSVAGCKPKPPADEHKRTPPRTDYSREEFGIGRQHTKSSSCNREIDQLLEQIRVCYSSRPLAECEVLQQRLSDRIGRLKNTSRCNR